VSPRQSLAEACAVCSPDAAQLANLLAEHPRRDADEVRLGSPSRASRRAVPRDDQRGWQGQAPRRRRGAARPFQAEILFSLGSCASTILVRRDRGKRRSRADCCERPGPLGRKRHSRARPTIRMSRRGESGQWDRGDRCSRSPFLPFRQPRFWFCRIVGIVRPREAASGARRPRGSPHQATTPADRSAGGTSGSSAIRRFDMIGIWAKAGGRVVGGDPRRRPSRTRKGPLLQALDAEGTCRRGSTLGLQVPSMAEMLANASPPRFGWVVVLVALIFMPTVRPNRGYSATDAAADWRAVVRPK